MKMLVKAKIDGLHLYDLERKNDTGGLYWIATAPTWQEIKQQWDWYQDLLDFPIPGNPDYRPEWVSARTSR